MENPTKTGSDIAWVLLFMGLFLPLMAGGMFVGAAYLTPAIIGTPNCVPRQGLEKIVEVGVLFGGMFVGMYASLFIFAQLTRRFLSHESHQRWSLQFERGANAFSPLQRATGRFILKYTKPRVISNEL